MRLGDLLKKYLTIVSFFFCSFAQREGRPLPVSTLLPGEPGMQ